MNMNAAENTDRTIDHTVSIVAAYVGKNPVSADSLAKLISDVHRSLASLGAPAPADAAAELRPAVPVKKSIQADHIICLEDGKKFKSLKRHLRTEYDMSPDDYRTKWGLPADYPMVAPSYSAQRSQLAKSIGLGRSSARH